MTNYTPELKNAGLQATAVNTSTFDADGKTANKMVQPSPEIISLTTHRNTCKE